MRGPATEKGVTQEPVTVILIRTGKTRQGYAWIVEPAFTVRLDDESSTIVEMSDEGHFWARGHGEEIEAALRATFNLGSGRPTFDASGLDYREFGDCNTKVPAWPLDGWGVK